MRRVLLAAVMAAGGCRGTPNCEEAIYQVAAHVSRLEPPKERSRALAQCIQEQWSAELRSCVAAARDDSELTACRLRYAPDAQKMRGASKAELAKQKAKRYAREAYPQWSAAHPDRPCPDKLEDLSPFLNDRDPLDPWGRPYRMLCGPTLAGAKGLAVVSAGEDGQPGTADDVKSWE